MTMILESAKRMGTLIDDLLGFSRIGRAQAHETMVSLDHLVKEVQNEVSSETEGRQVPWSISSLTGDEAHPRWRLEDRAAAGSSWRQADAQAGSRESDF